MSHKSQRFIADVMVGRLARYLRMAGYDVIYSNDAHDDLIIDIAAKENRVVLTRDTMMLKRKQFNNGILKSVFINDDSLREQLLQVSSYMNLELKPDLIICLICNSPLKTVSRENVKNHVPAYVYKTQDNFKYCRNCGKYYWRGTHFDYIEKYFNELNNTREI